MPKSFLISRNSLGNKRDSTDVEEEAGESRLSTVRDEGGAGDAVAVPAAAHHTQDNDEEDDMELVRADHDYLELLVKVKEEVEDLEEEEEDDADDAEIDKEDEAKSDLFNLAQLAEVSLAAEGRSENQALADMIKEARQRRQQQQQTANVHPSTPTSGSRMMQIVVPENASHIIICTSNAKNEANNNGLSSEGVKRGRKALQRQNYKCLECGKSYSTSSNLARHRQTHRSLQDKKAKRCPHCDKIYVSMPAFSMHLRTHNQTCKCDICGKAFSRPWLLQGHIRTHTGERPFPCHLCPKAFADKSNLRAHVQTHSNSKPFTCKKCGKRFALKSYLYKHEEAACNSAKHSSL